MGNKPDPVYDRNVVEFVAAANEYCKYAEHSSELKGDELLRILQRILPFLYLKASLLPTFEPVFDGGNEKFVTEAHWAGINDSLKKIFGTADEFIEVFDPKFKESEVPVPSSLAENITDIYQDLKDFLLLYQTGTQEVMNDAIWECKLNFENIWGQKLVNSLRAIHNFIYSGEVIEEAEGHGNHDSRNRKTEDWIISKRQREYGEDGKY